MARGSGVSRPAAEVARPTKMARIRGFLARAENVERAVAERLSVFPFEDSIMMIPSGIIRMPSRVSPTTMGTAA